jgi:di/tricarboxylate transporter
MLFARRWLPDTTQNPNSATSGRPSLAGWIEQYKLAGREHQVRITERSPLIGKTIEEIGMQDQSGANLIAIQRNQKLIQPTPNMDLRTGDILLLDLIAPNVDVDQLRQKYFLESIPLSGAYFTDKSQEIGMAEVIVRADSQLVGQTVMNSRFRDRTGLSVIGLRRGRIAHETSLQKEALKTGDTLLLIGTWKDIQNVQSDGKGVVALSLPIEFDEVLPVANRIWQALFCLLLVVGLMVSGMIPNVQAALLGCLLMGGLGCITLESAYRSIDWKTIVLIVGMLPFSTALQRTGGVDLAADALMNATSGLGTYGVLAILFSLTALLGMFISNTATAVLMAPVALAMADDLHASPYPFAMIVALAASTAFMTPVSSPVNTLVVTPGNYSFSDFVKIGVPFSIAVMLICVFMVPWLLPLYSVTTP